MSAYNTKELDRLIYALCDETITDEEYQQLQDVLLQNEEARKRYLKLLELHNMLEVESEHGGVAAGEAVVPIDLYLKKQRKAGVFRACLAAAAVLVAVAVMMRMVMAPEPEVLASIHVAPYSEFTISHAEGADVDSGANALVPGSSLKLSQGTIELSLSSGVKSIVQAPAELTMVDASELALHRGKAWFKVPPEATGFTVETPQVRAIDLGTEFGVVSHGQDSRYDQVHVLDGRVEVTTLKGLSRKGIRRTEQLSAGMAREVHFTGNFSHVPLSKGEFLTSLPKGLPYLHWSMDVDLDHPRMTSGTEVIASSIESVPTRSSVVQVPGRRGRAVAFAADNGGLRTNWSGIDGDRPRTIACWIKSPKHQPVGAIIGWGEHFEDGAKWRMTLNPEREKEGGVRGAIRTEFGYGYVIGSTDLRDGEWHHVVSVYDGSGEGTPESIKLYVDGVPEAVSAYKENIVLTELDDEKSASCVIGYNFQGTIDELKVYQGVLPAAAVQSLYQEGSEK
ncbi:FecR domain-containing protein [Verrucomicrobiaceae bacterium N1E253]|uniref:FecR domain-containing protein n=1 Tax=Oceaniferula marina TaxID=2748318 RepID=A0A851GI15_9BACT|nr:LamG-like jellyroll fold domain-containing protein [Oceaniferula marina]NWK56542.1 FecR domain-containing protein [Oceaniferula marina]